MSIIITITNDVVLIDGGSFLYDYTSADGIWFDIMKHNYSVV